MLCLNVVLQGDRTPTGTYLNEQNLLVSSQRDLNMCQLRLDRRVWDRNIPYAYTLVMYSEAEKCYRLQFMSRMKGAVTTKALGTISLADLAKHRDVKTVPPFGFRTFPLKPNDRVSITFGSTTMRITVDDR